jgi:hypothetical protein
MTNLNASLATILQALRSAVESHSHDPYIDSICWGIVYLDNARPSGMSRHKFAGNLSALKAVGLYAPTHDPAFGKVRIEG